MYNICLLTDSYKVTHWKQYPENTEEVYSYFESRGGLFDQTVFFGLQYFLKEYLEGMAVTYAKIEEAKEICHKHFGTKLFNEESWAYIREHHKGKLPVSIKAVPEGKVIPTQNVLMTIENTDPNCYWLTNYLETLLVQCWYPTTVATLSREIKKVILSFLEETGDPALIDFKLHDFGFRGVSSVESAGIGGAAHLINFKGTDTLHALSTIKTYYKTDVCGYSIPASEHSTITAWGKEQELEAYRNMLDQYPTGLVACVSDSYNIYEACEQLWGTKLRKQILMRDGCLVIRPDSGKPDEVVIKVLDILSDKFGCTTNKKGYKVLDPHVRIIQGDGVDYNSIRLILQTMKEYNYSADNIAFGMGGALLQRLDRDTQKFAFKCSNIIVDGENREVYKQPVTDMIKRSKPGKLKLVLVDGPKGKTYRTLKSSITGEEDQLVEVFRNGEILKEYTFDEIRKNAEI